MDPVVVDYKKQTFRGETYYKCGPYFRKGGNLLHRRVWEFNNDWTGVPPGHHIHHRDGDTTNNTSANLQLLSIDAHLDIHQRMGHTRAVPPAARAAAAKWHGSQEGRDWHKIHYANNALRLHVVGEFSCDYCGSAYSAEVRRTNRFCSNTCKSNSRRVSGVDDEERACAICADFFIISRYSRTKTCSWQCRTELRKTSLLTPKAA